MGEVFKCMSGAVEAGIRACRGLSGDWELNGKHQQQLCLGNQKNSWLANASLITQPQIKQYSTKQLWTGKGKYLKSEEQSDNPVSKKKVGLLCNK